MKQIINRKIYDTRTATCIGGFENSYSTNDFKYLSEWLYKTAKGQYFIKYSGGPMTEYAEPCGSGMSGSSGIKLISRDEIFDWIEERSSLFSRSEKEDVLAELGEIEEG